MSSPSTKPFFLNIGLMLMTSIWMGGHLLASPSQLQAEAIAPHPESASSQSWQSKAQKQSELSQNQHYAGCIFGDSISSGLGNSLGEDTFNFALGGLSSVSLLEQLNILKPSNFQCQQVIIAIGTNDAMNGTDDRTFVQNLKQAIALLQARGVTQVILFAAFYATQEASNNPSLAGTNERIQEINNLIQAVATAKQLPYRQEELQPLFEKNTLRKELTVDGVHLNDAGKQIYRKVILKILNPLASK